MTVKHKEQAEGQEAVIDEGGQGPATPGTAARCEVCNRTNCYRASFPDSSWAGGKSDCYRIGAERLKAENASLLESLRAAEKRLIEEHDLLNQALDRCNELSGEVLAAEQRAEAAEKRNIELQGALRAARQAMEWATEDDAGRPLRSSTIGKLYQAIHAVDEALKGPAAKTPSESLSGTAAQGEEK